MKVAVYYKKKRNRIFFKLEHRDTEARRILLTQVSEVILNHRV